MEVFFILATSGIAVCKALGLCNKRSSDITKTNREIGWRSWPAAMGSTCAITLLFSIAHGWSARLDEMSTSAPLSTVKNVRSR